jgi:hypothetical protein
VKVANESAPHSVESPGRSFVRSALPRKLLSTTLRCVLHKRLKSLFSPQSTSRDADSHWLPHQSGIATCRGTFFKSVLRYRAVANTNTLRRVSAIHKIAFGEPGSDGRNIGNSNPRTAPTIDTHILQCNSAKVHVVLLRFFRATFIAIRIMRTWTIRAVIFYLLTDRRQIEHLQMFTCSPLHQRKSPR